MYEFKLNKQNLEILIKIYVNIRFTILIEHCNFNTKRFRKKKRSLIIKILSNKNILSN
jgi:hypothetical protein